MPLNTDLNQQKNKIKPLKLTKDDLKKCRFVCIDQNLRLFECQTHKTEEFAHGLRLHPPHLWQVIDGVPYKVVDNKKVIWYDVSYAKTKSGR